MTERSLTPLPLGFHGDKHLLALVDALAKRADLYLETGANVGSTLGYVARRFRRLDCLACEPDPAAHAVARAHADVRSGVHVLPLTSQDFLAALPALRGDLGQRTPLCWLDAHGYGFEWPLRDEVAFLTRACRRGFLLIDDFRVPGAPEFEWDAYGDQECRFEAVRSAIAPRAAYRLFYPAYSEHTSPWHGLRGFGLIAFAESLAEIPRFDLELPEICRQACAAEGLPLDELDLEGELSFLRSRAEVAPGDAELHNALAALHARLGETHSALAELTRALELDPEHPDAGANLKALLEAQRGQPGKRQAVAPGPSGPAVQRDPFRDLLHLVSSKAPLIVDGGAHRGHTVARFLELFPRASLVAFEPQAEAARDLRARFPGDPRLTVHQAALAAEPGLLELARLSNDQASSLLPVSAHNRQIHGERLDVVARERVPAVPLRHAVSQPIDVLKLDLQGYELEALRGAGELLKDVQLILTEVEYLPLYAGQPLFSDIDLFLRGQGFRLFHLYSTWCHPSGQISSGDALYLNERFFS
jgi:FkbM family methyltransferase